jgi:predicted RNA-binding protein with RPS1 domain
MKAAHILLLLIELSEAFQPLPRLRITTIDQFCSSSTKCFTRSTSQRHHLGSDTKPTTATTTAITATTTSDGATYPQKPCFWRLPTGAWAQRINFDDLEVGQKLTGVLVQERLDAKTGPKVWFDCGVGRMDRKSGDWHIVTGMNRIRDRKESVMVKKVARLRKKQDGVEVWVSRKYPENGMFEVVTREEEIPKVGKTLISVSSLKPKQELIGKVVRIEPFGVLVDVGANRAGLLHVQKVADLFGTYIDKAEGLVEAGLELGAKIRVMVASNEKKRLFLDFPDDVKIDAQNERDERAKEKERRSGSRTVTEPDNAATSGVLSAEEAAAWIEFATAGAQPVVTVSTSTGGSKVSEEQVAAWAECAASDTADEEFDDEDEEYYDDDDDDEDRSIEDALGIGMY